MNSDRISEPEQEVVLLTGSTQPPTRKAIMSEQSTPAPVFFQPLPEHDNLNTSYFLAKVAEQVLASAGGCWVWTGSKVGRGYGRIDFGGQKRLVHRIVYQLCVGKVENRIEVCHNCPCGDNPACCNPSHLFVGTHTDNMRDASRKGRIRSNPLRGESHQNSKLTDERVREIRRRVAAGENGRIIAADYGISRCTVSEVANRKKWAHVSDESPRNERMVKCKNCNGRGEVRQWGLFQQTVGCEDCGGTGEVPVD